MAVLLLGLLLSAAAAPLEFKRKRGLEDYDYLKCMAIVERLDLAKFNICEMSRNQEFSLALGVFVCILGCPHRCPHNECRKNQNVVPNLLLCR